MIELRHRSRTELQLAFGGDTLNFAVYLARLTRERDVRVDYVTALGDDAYSDAMLATWQAEDVGTGLVARLAGRLPGLYTIRTDASGERSFTYWRSAAAAREMLQDGRAERLLAELGGYDLLYLSGVTLSILDDGQRQALMGIADAVRDRGGRVAFDSNYRPVGWPDPATARTVFDEMLTRADIALPTLDDDQLLFGVAGRAPVRRPAAPPGGRRGRGQARRRRLLPVVGGVHRRGAVGPGRRGRRQHRGRRQLQCRLSRRAPVRRRARSRGPARLRARRPGDRPPGRDHPGLGDGGTAGAVNGDARRRAPLATTARRRRRPQLLVTSR